MIAKHRKCTWCFQEITDEFIMTDEGEYLHLECYREADKVIEQSKDNNKIIH